MSMERIESQGEIIAIIVRKASTVEGIQFFSPPEFSQQLGLITRKKDYSVKRHVHKLVARQVLVTQEVLYLLFGRIEITLYDKYRSQIKTVELSQGDTILLAGGGHGIKFLEDSKILEIKQGPYSGTEADKEHF
ncbi:MAG TPA: hypothetical protein DCL49_14535 [Candidatus Omnitrophica bacterium]|nr:hypothetical protein [Candidatus Omnitrophota bacterium]